MIIFRRQFNPVFPDRLGLDREVADAPPDQRQGVFLRQLIPAAEDKDIGVIPALAVGEEEQHKANDDRADDRQRDHPGADDNPDRQRPEEVDDLHRLLDRRPEPDDRQSAHHAQRQDDVGGDRHDDQRRHQRQPRQRQREPGRVHDAGEGLFVDEVDKQPDRQCKGHAEQGVEDGKCRNIFQKAGLEDVAKCHGGSSCSLNH